MRHAKSSWKDISLRDHERPLNKRGHRDAPEMGRRLKKHGVRPSLIVSSPAVRAWSTAKAVAKEIGYPSEFLEKDPDLYHASVERSLDVIVSQDERCNNLMLFGHNPGFTDFANFLVPGLTNNLPTAGIVSVAIHQDDWNLFEQPPTELLVHDWPKKE